MHIMTTKAASIRLARKAFDALSDLQGIYRAYDQALQSERRYRRGDWSKYHKKAASAPACAKMFVVRWLAEYAQGITPLPDLADTLHMRQDVVLCAGIVARYGADAVLAPLRAAEIDPAAVATLDYTVFTGPVT